MAEGGRLIAIGDIHGHLEALEALLLAIDPVAGDRLVFLGDYIDRGPESFGVVERLLSLAAEHEGCVFLRGNHEQSLLSWLFGSDDTFLYLGGRQTRESYCRAAGVPCGEETERPEVFRELIPARHLRFFDETRLFWAEDGVTFVHGGLDPRVAEVQRQSVYDVLMGGRGFFQAGGYSGQVVVGHTSTQIFRSERPVFLPNGIVMCDTSCERTGLLSAVDLRSREVYQGQQPGRREP